MNVKELSSKKLYREYLIEVPYEEIDKSINSKILELVPTVTMPGFRKGKAPLNIVKKKYENNVLNEVVENIVKEKTKKLLDDKKLKAFRQPKVEIRKYQKNEPVELGIKIDLQPQIDVFPFDKINTFKYSIEIDKKTSEENYKSFINSQTIYSKIKDNRVVKQTDKIIVNIITKDTSVPDFLKTQENVSLVTDSDYQVLPDISSLIIKNKGKEGDKLNLKFDLKKVINQKKEKLVEFEIEILEIHEKIPFKVDKDFLSKNKLKSEKELIDNVNKNLEYQYESYLREIEKKQLMDSLETKNNFDVPDGIFEEEFNIIWHRVEHAKKDNKLDDDDKKLSESDLKKRYEKIALRRVKLAILMQHLANENNISVSEKELKDAVIDYTSQYPGQEKQIMEYLAKNPSGMESIRGPIFEKKIVDFIYSKTNKKEKKINTKEFDKLQKETFSYSKVK